MTAFEKALHLDLILADLNQALELVAAGKYDLAQYHIDQAKEKIEQMKTVDTQQKQLPKPTQPALKL